MLLIENQLFKDLILTNSLLTGKNYKKDYVFEHGNCKRYLLRWC